MKNWPIKIKKMLIYLFIYILLLIGAYVSERSVFVLYIILALFAFIVGYRADTVGMDTETYYNLYESLGNYGYLGYPEPIFGILCEFSNKIGIPFPLFQTILMFLALCMTALAIRRESNNYCLSMFLMLSMYFICYAMNIYRQIIACFIMVYACSLLINNHQKWKFAFWVLVAAGFHLFALVMLPVMLLNKIRLSKKLIYISLALSLLIGMVSILNLLVPLLGSYGTLYIENQGDEYAKTGIRLILAFLISVYWTVGFFYLYKHADDEFKESLYMKMFLVGIIFYNLLIRHDLGLRVTLYFLFPMIIGLSVFVDTAKMNRLKAQALVVSYTSIYYFLFLAMNSANVVPYTITQD